MGKPWQKFHPNELDEIGEVIPLDDLAEHTYGPLCDCRPNIVSGKSGRVFVHNSYDRREFNEPSELQNSTAVQQ